MKVNIQIFFNKLIYIISAFKKVRGSGETLREKCPYLELFWPYFLAFGLNTERYEVSLCIHSRYGKILARITPNTDTFYTVRAIIL